MKTRIVIYRRRPQTTAVEFGIEASLTFLCEIPSQGLDAFATSHGLRRCADFDWAVGDAGRVCALFEQTSVSERPGTGASQPSEPSQPSQPVAAFTSSLLWASFPDAAKILKDGTDKRFLQLAVQYIAAGGVEDSVLATDYDKNFLETMRSELEKQWEKEPPK
jgi:hypothetical protein